MIDEVALRNYFYQLVTLRHLRKSFHDSRGMPESFVELNMYQETRQMSECFVDINMYQGTRQIKY